MKWLIVWLTCRIRGHLSRRLNGTYFVVCDRDGCDAVLNLRVSTWQARQGS